jgi:trans-aconitate 2-methyltransferase
VPHPTDAPPATAVPSSYAFGDSHAAAERLALLAEVFEPATRALLDDLGLGAIDHAVDLGCGPGHTTALLARTLGPRRLTGVDRSTDFLGLARLARTPGATFVAADVTAASLAIDPADLVYSRYVLSHLASPEVTVAGWVARLRPGGHLVTEENEWILMEDPLLADYCALATALVAHHGGDLLVGTRLERMRLPPECAKVLSRVYVHRVRTARAAGLFARNFALWRSDPWIVRHHSPAALDAMARGLDGLARADGEAEVTFALRQIAIRRLEPAPAPGGQGPRIATPHEPADGRSGPCGDI